MIHQRTIGKSLPQLKSWASKMLVELQQALSKLLPLSDNEKQFIREVRTAGKIAPELIINDTEFANKILLHPALHWSIQYWTKGSYRNK